MKLQSLKSKTAFLGLTVCFLVHYVFISGFQILSNTEMKEAGDADYLL